jgi:ATP-binding cassette subfamily B protein
MRPYKPLFFLSLLLLPLISGFSLVQPYLVKVAIDRHIVTGNLQGLIWISMLFVLVVLIEGLAFYSQYTLTMHLAQKSLSDLRVSVFAHVQQLPMSYFDKNPVGRLVTRMTTDTEVLNEMFGSGVMTLALDGLTLIGIVIILFSINAWLALVALSMMPVVIVGINFFRVRARASYRAVRERIARINSYLQEAISGMMVIQLFSRQAKSFAEFDRLNASYKDANQSSNIYEAAMFSFVDAVSSISVAIILWYGAGLVRKEIVAFGTLVAFIQYIHRFFVPLRDFSQKYSTIQSAMAAAERIFQLLDTPRAPRPAIPAPVPKPSGLVEFQDVRFEYKKGDPVLRGVSFRLEPGERVALVGRTGSGKTTTIKLLSRFYDVDSGSIRVDGLDVRDWDLAALRSRIGTVLQDVFLFSGDVIQNIRLGNSCISSNEVESAARGVHAHPFIVRLQGEYHAVLRERGSNLSQGQKQLLSLARALAFQPRILVLDEATSSVDPETELLIQDALDRLMKGRTSLIIAHRLSTIQKVDRIIVLHHGEVKEIGTHNELLAKRGIYRRLYLLQYGKPDKGALGLSS